MSGELQIVFIYDTLSVRNEEDDPTDAILYFHPDCIPEERRIAICGQLMGITHFLVDTFSAPKILTLENGKFAMRKFGRQYVLALGCSSVTPDWLLEKQADILYNLTIFFHRDIKSILQSVKGDRLQLSSRLSLIMDHYIPISQHHGDLFALTFGILPILNLPKSASNISLSAAVVLQSCIMRNGVLGGIVMYQNKVLGVELGQDLAQKLAFIQPYQLPPAEPVRQQFASPPGVQIFTVYVSEKELEKLRKHCSTFQHPSHCEPNVLASNEKNNQKGKIDSIREEEDQLEFSSSLGFSEPSSKELSEEPVDHESSVDTGKGNSLKKVKSPPKDLSVSLESKIKFEEFLKASNTLKPAHQSTETGEIVSQEEDVNSRRKSVAAVPPPCVHMNGCGPNGLKSSRVFKSLEALCILDDSSTENSTPPGPISRFCASLTDPYFPFIRCDGKSISKALFLDVYAGAEEPNPCNEEDKENETEVNPVSKDDNNSEIVVDVLPGPAQPAPTLLNGSLSPAAVNPPSLGRGIENSATATGFSLEGEATVAPEAPLAAPRRPMDLPLNSKKYSRKKSKRRWSTFEDMMSPAVDTPSRVSESFPAVISNINETWQNSATAAAPTSNPSHQELYSSFRKLSSQDELHDSSSHTHSVNYLSDNTSSSQSLVMNNIAINRRIPSTTSKAGGELPTLKLSSISDRKARLSGVSNRDGHAHREHSENVAHHNKSTSERSNTINTKRIEKASLFIYSLGSMRLLLLLEKERCIDHEFIRSLWEYGSSSLSELETAISNVEEQTMSTTASQHDHYCYLHYEAVWRSLAHGGRNHSMDFDVVQQMHQDFNVYPNIGELIIRGEDHVVYGYQCVGSEVFYQQSAGLQPGLPMPSDLMGKVPFKAKRRLERDHNILLL